MPDTDINILSLTKAGEDIDVLSLTKPIAKAEYKCMWSHDQPHYIPKGKKHVRVVYEDKAGEMITDRICVQCWTTK